MNALLFVAESASSENNIYEGLLLHHAKHLFMSSINTACLVIFHLGNNVLVIFLQVSPKKGAFFQNIHYIGALLLLYNQRT